MPTPCLDEDRRRRVVVVTNFQLCGVIDIGTTSVATLRSVRMATKPDNMAKMISQTTASS